MIEPSRVSEPRDVPVHCVIRFFKEVIDEVVAEQQAADDGTAYHDLPPGRKVQAERSGVVALQAIWDQRG